MPITTISQNFMSVATYLHNECTHFRYYACALGPGNPGIPVKGIKDDDFQLALHRNEKDAWEAFELVARGLLGNR